MKLTWDVEKLFWLKSSTLVLVELGEVFVKFLEFLLSDYILSVSLLSKFTYSLSSSIDLGLWLADFPCFYLYFIV